MAYFSDFPQVVYGTPEASSLIKDISLRFSILPIVIRNEISWFDILYKDHETMEDLAQNYYGDPSLWWVIMVVNGIIDPFYDLPLRYRELIEYIDQKYEDIYAIHHYETTHGIIVNKPGPGELVAIEVTNQAYEIKLNDAKRQIKIIDPVYIPTIVNNLQGLLS